MSSRILLADDSLTIQKVVELTFSDTDYEVVAVSSGDDLLEKLPECSPDIVICDVIMPGRDGYDVCQEIKSSPDHLHLPVILLTGTFEPFDRDRALAVGCSEIITKPFEAKRLVEAVERLTSDSGATHQPTPSGGESDEIDDGRVVPPKPISAVEELVDVESTYDLADTAITADSGAAEPMVDATEPVFEATEAVVETADPFAEGTESPAESAEEALDFTKSGFHEMETAGKERAERVLQPPDEGLEFDLDGGDDENTETAGAAEDQVSPFAESDFESEVIREDDVEEPFSPAEAAEEPTAPDTAGDEPFPIAEEPEFETPDQAPDHDQTLTTPINVAEVMGTAPTEARLRGDSFEATESPDETDSSNADTQDFGAPETAPPDAPAPEAEQVSAFPHELSEADVDRIARRVLELSHDRLDQIAWEVLPDMAEIVVRERLREIEAEAGHEES